MIAGCHFIQSSDSDTSNSSIINKAEVVLKQVEAIRPTSSSSIPPLLEYRTVSSSPIMM